MGPDIVRIGPRTGAAYWAAMLVASGLGTNLGDFGAGWLGLGQQASFAVLAVLGAAAVVSHVRLGFGYWAAIVLLRAASTNVGDALRHDWHLGYVVPSVALLVLTLLAGWFTGARQRRPVLDWRYWLAMVLAGVFGTVAGDYASHLAGLWAATGWLCLATGLAALARERLAAGMLAYWGVVLVERCAGTALGDAVAFARPVRLGLPLSMLVFTAILLGLLLVLRRARDAAMPFEDHLARSAG